MIGKGCQYAQPLLRYASKSFWSGLLSLKARPSGRQDVPEAGANRTLAGDGGRIASGGASGEGGTSTHTGTEGAHTTGSLEKGLNS